MDHLFQLVLSIILFNVAYNLKCQFFRLDYALGYTDQHLEDFLQTYLHFFSEHDIFANCKI